MKIAIKTINRYLKNKLSTEEIVQAIEKTEVEIEQIYYSKSLDPKIIAGKVLKLKPHPDADRLRVAMVDIGASDALQIVCGAPNIEAGQHVPVATIGTTLPDGTKITKAKLRGVKSEGMICSPNELGLSDDAAGIMVLDHSASVGTTLCDIVKSSDWLDIKTQPSRWDHLSIVGLSRDICVYGPKNDLILPETDKIVYSNSEKVNVKEKGDCKRFLTARLKVNNDVKSPTWLVDNLESNGVRSINPIVDITNFVMLETGQPSHAYDAKKITGDLQVRYASPSESITTLDGKTRQLNRADLVIADDKKVVGLAGVMGSSNSEVSMQTAEIILETANFDKTVVRRAALRHGLRTEASARFERSLPLPLQPLAFERLIYLLKQICQAQIIEGPFDQLYGWPWISHIGLRVRRTEKVLGLKIDEKVVASQLKKLGFEVEHFSLTGELRKHLGKPYKWGANFKQDGDSAFDCSYLVDYLYSLIGIYVGHTALAQYEYGQAVEINKIKPGDVVFYEGLISKSTVDHYYIRDENGNHNKIQLEKPKKVGHNGIYTGNNKVIMAAEYEYKAGKWAKRADKGVIEVPLSEFVNNPGFLGVRRYVESFNHIMAVTAPWWRTDIALEEDMIEEVAKIIGYENIPANLPSLPVTDATSHSLLPDLSKLKDMLVSRGLFEVMTYSFVSQKTANLAGVSPADMLEIENPSSPEQQYLRTNLFSSMLTALVPNQLYKSEFGMFELSKVYQQKPGAIPDQPWSLGLLMRGQDSLAKLQGIMYSLIAFTRSNLKLKKQSNVPYLAEKRQSSVWFAGKQIGVVGQVKPSLLDRIGFNGEASYGELMIEPIVSQNSQINPIAIPSYQFIIRDIALELDEAILWQDLKAKVLKASAKIVKIEFVSQFQNELMQESGHKSLAWRAWLDMGANPKLVEIDKEINTITTKLVQDKSLAVAKIR